MHCVRCGSFSDTFFLHNWQGITTASFFTGKREIALLNGLVDDSIVESFQVSLFKLATKQARVRVGSLSMEVRLILTKW
jgi:hypothetical protein